MLGKLGLLLGGSGGQIGNIFNSRHNFGNNKVMGLAHLMEARPK